MLVSKFNLDAKLQGFLSGIIKPPDQSLVKPIDNVISLLMNDFNLNEGNEKRQNQVDAYLSQLKKDLLDYNLMYQIHIGNFTAEKDPKELPDDLLDIIGENFQITVISASPKPSEIIEGIFKNITIFNISDCENILRENSILNENSTLKIMAITYNTTTKDQILNSTDDPYKYFNLFKDLKRINKKHRFLTSTNDTNNTNETNNSSISSNNSNSNVNTNATNVNTTNNTLINETLFDSLNGAVNVSSIANNNTFSNSTSNKTKFQSSITYKIFINDIEDTKYDFSKQFEVCKNTKMNIYVPIDRKKLSLDYRIIGIISEHYKVDLFNKSDPFFVDHCRNYTEKETKQDTVQEWRRTFYQNLTFQCQTQNQKAGIKENCHLKEVNPQGFLVCECDFVEDLEIYSTYRKDEFTIPVIKNAGIITCVNQFKFKDFLNNYGTLTITVIATIYVLVAIINLLFPVTSFISQNLPVLITNDFSAVINGFTSNTNIPSNKIGKNQSKNDKIEGVNNEIYVSKFKSKIPNNVGIGFGNNDNIISENDRPNTTNRLINKLDVYEVEDNDEINNKRRDKLKLINEKLQSAKENVNNNITDDNDLVLNPIILPKKEEVKLEKETEKYNPFIISKFDAKRDTLNINDIYKKDEEDIDLNSNLEKFDEKESVLNGRDLNNEKDLVNTDKNEIILNNYIDNDKFQTEEEKLKNIKREENRDNPNFLGPIIEEEIAILNMTDLKLKDFRHLESPNNAIKDQRSSCAYFWDTFKSNHILLNLFFLKSIVVPFGIRFVYFLIVITSYFIFNALLHFDSYILKKLQLYPLSNALNYSIVIFQKCLISMVIVVVFRLLLVYLIYPSKDVYKKLNESFISKQTETIDKALNIYKSSMLVSYVIFYTIFIFLLGFSLYYLTVFSNLYKKTSVIWISGSILTIVIDIVAIGVIYPIITLLFRNLTQSNPEKFYGGFYKFLLSLSFI